MQRSGAHAPKRRPIGGPTPGRSRRLSGSDANGQSHLCGVADQLGNQALDVLRLGGSITRILPQLIDTQGDQDTDHDHQELGDQAGWLSFRHQTSEDWTSVKCHLTDLEFCCAAYPQSSEAYLSANP